MDCSPAEPQSCRDLLSLPALPGHSWTKQTPGHTVWAKEGGSGSQLLTAPTRATSAQPEPNYRAVGRAAPTGSQQKALANTREKLLCWHPSLSLLSSSTGEQGLTPQTAVGSHWSSTGQTKLCQQTPQCLALPRVSSPAQGLQLSCTPHNNTLLLTPGFPHPSHQAFSACGAAVPV